MSRNVTLDAEKSAAAGPRAGSVFTWVRLIQRVYEVDPLERPQCGGVLKITRFSLRRPKPGRSRVVETLFTVRPNLRTEAAVEIFRSGELSLLRASEIAGLDFESFRRLLQDRGIPWEIECGDSAQMDRAVADFLLES